MTSKQHAGHLAAGSSLTPSESAKSGAACHESSISTVACGGRPTLRASAAIGCSVESAPSSSRQASSRGESFHSSTLFGPA